MAKIILFPESCKAIAEAVPRGKTQMNLDAFGLGFESVEAVG